MRRLPDKKYVGILNDMYGGMTDTGKIVRDAWIFGLIPETETCEGWMVQGMQDLWEKVQTKWEEHGFLVSRLPPDIRERFDRIQAEAIERARAAGWNPQHDIEDDEEDTSELPRDLAD